MITAIIQARMGSVRLANKVMLDIAGHPMLWHVINRVGQAETIDQVIVATGYSKENKQIVKLAREAGVKSFVGSENDVLDRYYQAAKNNEVAVIVRITGDCPLIDPRIIDETVRYFLENEFDYVSTAHITKDEVISSYPDGLDVEVFSITALEKAWQGARLPSEREHVTPYIWKHPHLFKVRGLESDKDFSSLRWTVDKEKDLEFVREVYKRMGFGKKMFYMENVLELLAREPQLANINRSIKRDEGYFKSLKTDKQNGRGNNH